MKTALFIIFPVPSHYNICFGLADSLRKKGYRVVFAGTKSVEHHVESQEFEFVELQYLQEIIVTNWRVALGLFLISALEKNSWKARYRDFLTAIAAVQSLCKYVMPDEIYIDEHLNFYWLLLKSSYPNCTLINTKLPTQRVQGIPPLTCSVPFKNNIWYKAYSWWLWELYMVRHYYGSWRKWVALLGIDDQLFLRKVAARMDIDISKYIKKDNLLHDGLTGVPIIHLVPREMEYNWYAVQPNEYFFYQPYTRKRKEDTELFWIGLRPLLTKKERQEIRIVYASLGTLSGANSEPARRFLERLIAAFRTLSDIHLILADKYLFFDQPESLPHNVHLVDWAPQTELLPYCDLMITHGGTNSILECVQAGVPLLSYPLNLQADHPGNTARLVANGWGIQGNLREGTQADIRRKILKIITESYLLPVTKQVKILPEIIGNQKWI